MCDAAETLRLELLERCIEAFVEAKQTGTLSNCMSIKGQGL